VSAGPALTSILVVAGLFALVTAIVVVLAKRRAAR
jgi:LPXTG-motif cell wall-anchored protein